MSRRRSPAQREFDALPCLGRREPRQGHALPWAIALALAAAIAATLLHIWS